MNKLIIFDLDGTLLDSISDVAVCFNKVLEENNLPTYTVDEFRLFVGGDLEQVIGRLLPKEKSNDAKLIASIKQGYKNIYADYSVKHSRAYAGVDKLLLFLKEKGIKAAIHTNKNQLLTEGIIKSKFSYVDFVAIVGSEGGLEAKPSSEGVEYLIKRADFSKEDTVYVGDTATDVLTAKNSNIMCYYAKWGQGKSTDIALYDNIVQVESISELIKALGERLCRKE